ncbi:MAG: hypothetical protein FJ128_13625 [Deltaproteobacteria bacterium]|nr:hypothetical protein [Deltaproteobacteria bacterium]
MKLTKMGRFLLLLALVSWGCGQANTPEAVVGAFLSSLPKQDVKQAAVFIGDQLKYDKEDLPLLVEAAARKPLFKVVPEVAQDKAVVLVFWEDSAAAFVFVLHKEGEAWKITHIRGGSGKMR